MISATNGKTTTAAMVAAILERTRRAARPQPRRREHGRRRRHRAAGGRARAAARIDGDAGLFEVDEFWLGQVVDELAPARAAARQPVPRPARPLRRARDDRRPLGGGRRRARRRRALVLNADDPLVADLGRDRAGRRCTSASRTTRWRCPSCSTPPTPSTAAAAAHAYVYDAVYLGHLGRYHCPNCGARRPEPGGRGHATSSCDGIARRALHAAHAARASARVELPLPGLYNVYNALGAAALCLALGAPLDDVVAGPGRRSRPRSAAPRPCDLGGRDLSILLVKNPAGANEVLRTLALEAGEHDLLGVLNDRIADGRDVSGSGTPTSSCSPPRVRRVTCCGHARGRAGAAAEVRGRDRRAARASSSDARATALDARAAPTATGRSYALPTYTALLELRELLVAPRRRAGAYWR